MSGYSDLTARCADHRTRSLLETLPQLVHPRLRLSGRLRRSGSLTWPPYERRDPGAEHHARRQLDATGEPRDCEAGDRQA